MNSIRFLSAIIFLSFTLIMKAFPAPFPTNGTIVLSFPSQASEEEQRLIQVDFTRCLDVSRPFLHLLEMDIVKTNDIYLAGLWVPNKYPVVVFPKDASRTNEIFTISLNEAFMSEYRQHVESLSSYTNEIAQMESFIQSLSPTNLATMTDDELLGGLILSKEWSPGTHGVPSFLIPSQKAAILSCTYHMPPLSGFFTIDIGPSGQQTYLWALVPVVESDGVVTQPAIYYNGRWWLSNWMWEKGGQQWQ